MKHKKHTVRRIAAAAVILAMILVLAGCGTEAPAKNNTAPARNDSGAAPENTDSQENTNTAPEPAPEPVHTPSSMTLCKFEGVDYWLYTPEDASENMPLIVYLPSAKERGSDPKLVTEADSLAKYVKEGTLSPAAYIVFPQCAAGKTWTPQNETLIKLIKAVCSEHRINTEKVSLTGHSMGANDTWTLALESPELFYKYAPMSGSVKNTKENVNKLSKLTIWAFVGSADKNISSKSSEDMVASLKKAGADAEITVFKGATHFEVPPLAFLDESIDLVNWLTD